MKERKREKIAPIHFQPGDTIEVFYRETNDETGEIVTERTVIKDEIGREITVNEAVIFDIEEGDFGVDVEDGIGGALLKVKVKQKEE
jgi:hypothetical protein